MRLAPKILLLIVAVLMVGFGVSTYLAIEREKDLLVEQSKAAARRVAATLIASIEGAMLQERPDVTRQVLAELKTAPVEQFGVYRRNGVEAFTDLDTAMQVDRDAGLAPEVMANIRKMVRPAGPPMSGPAFQRALETITTQETLESRDGATFFTLHHPIPNGEKCQGCHGEDHKVRAVVRVANSMEPVFAEVQRHRDRQILVGLLTILAVAAVLTLAMRRVVVQPIEALAEVAMRVGEGDFGARARVRSRDEIGQLAGAFNEMTARLQESRQRLEVLEQMKGELAKFVPESVKKMLEQNPNATELEKKNIEVSVLFLDISGYTRLSETLEPKKLNQLVQAYFSSFLEIIQAHHGDINETAGDGLMVIFQAHPSASDHALNTTRAAFAIRQRVVKLNEEYAGVFPPVQLHMGINTGEALVGATKLGGAGAQRWTFTATGPTTNLAARFAGSAQDGEIVVGPLTAERIRSHFVLESLGEKTFKNVSHPIRVYRVIPPGVYEKIS
ncbi:MAG TPA: adenylate/guanylate cyclase domain-containing protein [Burkholderiales bacterium]|nr:adenylate/guanylate cyclase domain-containing protein [Burkholderiales bacterium]